MAATTATAARLISLTVLVMCSAVTSAMQWDVSVALMVNGCETAQVERTESVACPFVVRRTTIDTDASAAQTSTIVALTAVGQFVTIAGANVSAGAPGRFVQIDLNHDGVRDLVWTVRLSALVSAVQWARATTNTTAGTPGSPFSVPATLYTCTDCEIVLSPGAMPDFDGDGHADLLFEVRDIGCLSHSIAWLELSGVVHELVAVDMSGMIEPCLPILIGSGSVMQGVPAMFVSLGISCSLLLYNGTGLDTIALNDCPAHRSPLYT
jgi:hypothetical protein